MRGFLVNVMLMQEARLGQGRAQAGARPGQYLYKLSFQVSKLSLFTFIPPPPYIWPRHHSPHHILVHNHLHKYYKISPLHYLYNSGLIAHQMSLITLNQKSDKVLVCPGLKTRINQIWTRVKESTRWLFETTITTFTPLSLSTPHPLSIQGIDSFSFRGCGKLQAYRCRQ